MEKEKIKELTHWCYELDYFFRSHMDDFYYWAEKKHMAKAFDTRMKGKKDIIRDMPKDWYDFIKHRYCLERIFKSSSNLHKLIKTLKNELADSELAMLKHFEKKHWEYSLFSVKERVSEKLFLVYDYFKNKEYILYSGELQVIYDKEFQNGTDLYSGPLFDNGLCFQHFLMIDAYHYLIPQDLDSFAKMLNPKVYESQGTQKVIHDDPVPFYLIEAVNAFEDIIPGNKHIIFHTSECQVKNPDFQSLENYYHSELDGIDHWDIDDPEDTELFTNIFFDKKKGSLIIFSFTKEGYDLAVNLLDIPVIPKTAQYIMSAPMIRAARDILNTTPPGANLNIMFHAAERFHQELINSQKKSGLYTLAAYLAFLQADLYVDDFQDEPEEAREFIEKTYRNTTKALTNLKNVSIEGGIDGHKLPDLDWLRSLVDSEENKNVPFSFNRQCIKPEQGEEEFELEDVHASILDFADELWLDAGEYVTHYIYYLLTLYGKEYRPFRDYVLETAKAVWFLYGPEITDDLLNDIKGDLSAFFSEGLHQFGVIDIEGHSNDELIVFLFNQRIKSTGFLESWLDWQTYPA